jgi:hypothetical protein
MNNEKLKNALQEIQDRVELPKHIKGMLCKIADGTITIPEVKKNCFIFGINLSVAKIDFLHFIFEYIRIALNDDILSAEEKQVIGYFKRIFTIMPGDFISHTHNQVENVIKYHLLKMYSDNYITPEEALLKVDLQELFDLSFDQMNEYAKLEAVTSLKQGAAIGDLDVFFTHTEYFDLKNRL